MTSLAEGGTYRRMMLRGLACSLVSSFVGAILLMSADGCGHVKDRSPTKPTTSPRLPGAEYQATLRPCHERPSTVFEARAIDRSRLEERLSVHGLLVHDGDTTCTEMDCEDSCCNNCRGLARLIDSETLPSDYAPEVFLIQLQGAAEPLRWSARDCALPGLQNGLPPDVIVTATVRKSQLTVRDSVIERNLADVVVSRKIITRNPLLLGEAEICIAGQ